MANHKSAAKRARQSERRRVTNSQTKSKVKTFEKKLRDAIGTKNVNAARELLVTLSEQIDKAAQKGVFHVNKAARKISRLAQQVQQIGK